jgi:hypothetical protein
LSCLLIVKLHQFRIGLQNFLIILVTLFFAVFILSPFSSLFSIVEFIYVFLDAVLILFFIIIKSFFRIICR